MLTHLLRTVAKLCPKCEDLFLTLFHQPMFLTTGQDVTIWQVTSCGFAKNWIKTNAKKQIKNDVFLNQFRAVCLFYRFTTDTIWKIWATVKTIIGGYVTHNIVYSSQIVISLENWRHEKPSHSQYYQRKPILSISQGRHAVDVGCVVTVLPSSLSRPVVMYSGGNGLYFTRKSGKDLGTTYITHQNQPSNNLVYKFI